MREKQIIASEAFRAINLLIDRKALELAHWMNVFYDRVAEAYAVTGHISTRVHSEGKKRQSLPGELYRLHDMDDTLKYIRNLEREIGELQRYKLRLLNDYDFTHGDPAEQREVFNHAKPKPKARRRK